MLRYYDKLKVKEANLQLVRAEVWFSESLSLADVVRYVSIVQSWVGFPTELKHFPTHCTIRPLKQNKISKSNNVPSPVNWLDVQARA